ncbi:MAG: hypothetical protein U1D55_13455 [Phycisphaerae bacterium]
MRPFVPRAAFGLLLLVAPFNPAIAQSQPASPPTSAPVSPGQPIRARVIELKGEVEHAALASREWAACKVDDEYPPETKIRTGLRASIKLQIGNEEPYTAMVIESVGLTVLSEAYKTPDSKVVRVGVGYGKIRAGVAEGGLKSNFTVDSPVATLSKRGTWNFGLSYERATDHFGIFLLDRGLVDALKKATGESRSVLPGQIVTDVMRRWLDEAQVRENVPITDILGQEDYEVAFNRLDNDGLGVLAPGGGRAVVLDLHDDSARAAFALALRNANIVIPALGQGAPVGGLNLPQLRQEGFFGTGRGDDLVRLIVAQSNRFADGTTKPGTLVFRRDVLENWLSRQGK